MKIVIVGAGEVGTSIARQLIDDGKDVILIERDAESAKRASNSLDCLVVTGEGTHAEVLKEAGTAGADIFIAATTSDEVNIISCMIVAAEFDVPVKVARVHSVEYSKSRAFNSKISGVDYLVNTDREAAWEISQTIEQGADSTITIFKNTDVQMREYYIEQDDFYAGKVLKDLKTDMKEDFIVAGVVRKGQLTIPAGDFVIAEDDTIYIVADRRTFSRMASKSGQKESKLRKIAVVGGTPIGVAVAEYMTFKGRSVTIIDKDYDRCRQLTEEVPDAMIIYGDISDHTIYTESNINSMDAIICTTTNEELNIISGVYAKALGVKRVVAVVEKTSYLTVASSIGIDSTVSPKFCAVNAILKLTRKGNVRSIHSIFEGQAEAIEVTISETLPFVNKPLKEIILPVDCRIVAVNRNRKSIIPDGNFELKVNDQAIIFAKRASIAELEGMLT
ncbi:MAG: Trk system potassium transporter TrkA [Deferribacteraceae bacterium]|jgi:trk system potassium uptake protein TrkA|nr:Trk system potassium transporter TrkA [Deferribacteraceae bacterium]